MDENENSQEKFELGATKLTSAHHCSAGAGATWVSRGYGIFKKNPGLWMLLLLMAVVINTICRVIPVIGDIAAILISPVLTAGLAMVAHRCYMEFDAEFDDFFSGFRYRLWPLVQVGLLYLAGVFATVVIAIVICIGLIGMETIQAMSDMLTKTPEVMDPLLAIRVMIVVMIMLVLLLPVIMAYYFAPVLVMFHGVDAFAAMKLSFMACCNNAIPFLIYGLLVMLLMVLSIFTLFLGLLVLIPVLWASTYVAYRDIFLTEEQEMAA